MCALRFWGYAPTHTRRGSLYNKKTTTLLDLWLFGFSLVEGETCVLATMLASHGLINELGKTLIRFSFIFACRDFLSISSGAQFLTQDLIQIHSFKGEYLGLELLNK